jgi:hypothetical protein
MGVCYYGILWIIIPDLPQVAEVAETTEEEKNHMNRPASILEFSINSILANLLFNHCYITKTLKVQRTRFRFIYKGILEL